MTFRTIAPEELGAPKGFSHGLLAEGDGRILFVAGQTAGLEDEGVPKPLRRDFVEQFAVSLDKVLSVVREAGGRPGDIGRMTLYVTDLRAYLSERKSIGSVYQQRMGRHYPAMSLVEVKGLVDRGALIEIEATAVVPRDQVAD